MTKRFCLVFASLSIVATSVVADDAALLQRIVALEKRIAELEEKLAPVLEEERVKAVVIKQKELAKERMMLDADFYQRPDLRMIEQMYQKSVADWNSDACKEGLKALIKRYPRANRAGCAVLNLGQMTEGAEQLEYLEKAIQYFGGCYYDNGVQVGAYARLYLGMRYKKEEKDKKAVALFQELKTTFPDAIDHNGQLLSVHYRDMD